MAKQRSNVGTHNRLLRAGKARAARMEPKLASLVQTVIDRAADEASRNFTNRALDHQAPPAPAAPALAAAASVTSASAMVAVYPTPDEQAALSQPGGEPVEILHCTLAFLGEVDEEQFQRAVQAIGEVAVEHVPREGVIGGVGVFGDNGDGYPAIALPDVPGLPELRHAVTRALTDAGIEFAQNHGWLPHITLNYGERPEPAPVDLIGAPVTFRFLTVARGDVPVHLPLIGRPALTAGTVVGDTADPVVAEIAQVAETHAPDGGYGDTSWHAESRAVYWVSADWTGELVWVESALGPVRAAGEETGLPADWAAPSAGEVLDLEALVAQIRAKTDPVREATARTMMKDSLDKVGVSFDVTHPLVGKVLAQSGKHVTSIAETTRADVMRVIEAANKNGLSIPNTARLIRSAIKDASPARATLIARTEMNSVVNGASLAATQIVAEVTGDRWLKEWLTADGAEFPRHEEYDDLDGQTVELDDTFDVGGDRLEYPGDPAGDPSEVCNCRCDMVYVEASEVEGEPEPGEPEAAAE